MASEKRTTSTGSGKRAPKRTTERGNLVEPGSDLANRGALRKKASRVGSLEKMPGHAPIGLEESFILAYNVKRLREHEGMNKSKFSLVAGISRPTLDKIEDGRCDAQLSLLHKLASALGVTSVALITPPFEDVSMNAYMDQVKKL